MIRTVPGRRWLGVLASGLMLTTGAGVASAAAGSGSVMAEQDLSVSTDLWRREFFEVPNKSEGESDEAGGALASESKLRRSVLRNQNDLLVGTAPPITSLVQTGGLNSTPELPTLSDWEHAATKAIGPKEISITTVEGPSAVTLVVAVVGLIVIAGAYLQK